MGLHVAWKWIKNEKRLYLYWFKENCAFTNYTNAEIVTRFALIEDSHSIEHIKCKQEKSRNMCTLRNKVQAYTKQIEMMLWRQHNVVKRCGYTVMIEWMTRFLWHFLFNHRKWALDLTKVKEGRGKKW